MPDSVPTPKAKHLGRTHRYWYRVIANQSTTLTPTVVVTRITVHFLTAWQRASL